MDTDAALWEAQWLRLTGIPWAATLGHPRRLADLDVDLDTKHDGILTSVMVRGTALHLNVRHVSIVQGTTPRESYLRLDIPLWNVNIRSTAG